jgi:hypothetical protein
MELHNMAQHRFSRARRIAGLAVLENRWSRDVAHDEQTFCHWALPLEPSVRQSLTKCGGSVIMDNSAREAREPWLAKRVMQSGLS